jgi:hypothetical protein
MFEWFATSWAGFLALRPIEQLSTIFTIGGVLLGWMIAWWAIATRQLRLKKQELHHLQALCDNRSQQIRDQRKELKEQDEAIAALESQLPENWLRQAAKERQEENEERAIHCLRVGVESICQPLSACCFELATHHFSLVTDYGSLHFHEAERLARIAMLLAPSDETQFFLAELLATGAEAQYASSDYQAYDARWGEVGDFLKIGTDAGSIEALRNAANQYMEQGHYRLAERLFRRVVQMCRRHLGPDSVTTLEMRAEHAMAVGYAGRYREALSLFQALLPDWERVLGPDHPDTLTTHNNIAGWTGETGDAARAMELFQALLPDQERVLGADHPNTLTTRNNIAAWTGRTGDATRAMELSQALLPDRERVLGRDHLDTLRTRHNLASFTGQTGDAARALELLQTLLPDWERVRGRDHPDTLRIRNNIAVLTRQTGDVAQALDLGQALLQDREWVLGADHPDTLKTLGNIAAWVGELGDIAQVLELFQVLLADQERVLGCNHLDTLTTRNNIAALTGEMGDAARAMELFQALLPDRERVQGQGNRAMWSLDWVGRGAGATGTHR